MKRVSRLLVGVLGLALVSAACSGDGSADGVPAARYASALCSSMQTYLTDVTALSDAFVSKVNPEAPLEEQKRSVGEFLDEVLTATDTLIEDLMEAGVPDVVGGEEIVTAIRSSFDQARSVLEDARARVEALDVEDRRAFATELNAIGSTIQNSLGEIGTSLEGLTAAELASAVEDEPACAEVTGGA